MLRMNQILKLLVVLLFAGTCSGQTVETIATYNNVGISLTCTSIPPVDTVVTPWWRMAGSGGAFSEGHPLTRIDTNRFAGSLFGLAAGTTVEVELVSSVWASNVPLMVVMRKDAFSCVTNRLLHVATTGNDTNDGLSLATAFRTISHAVSEVQAGEVVWIHDGRYYEGDMDFVRSGHAGQPIVLKASPGAAPILDGTDTNFNPVWTLYDAGQGVYRAPWTDEPMNAYLNGQQLYHYLVYLDLATNRWEQPGGYYVDGSYLHLRMPGGVAPGTNVITVPRYTTGFTIDHQANIHLEGLTFCYFGNGTYHRGVYINGGDSNLVRNCRFHHVGIGVTLKRTADFNTVEYCDFSETPLTTWSWHAIKNGGVGYEAGGVAVYESSSPNRGNVIRFNTFTNMFDGSGLYSANWDGPTVCMDYHDNVLLHCGDDAMETDGAGRNVRIYNNICRDFLTGISVAPCAIGPTYIFRNVLADWHSVDYYEGYPFKFNVSSSLPIEWVYLYHNTCLTEEPGQAGFLFKGYSDWTNIISRNNLFGGTRYALESWSSQNPVDFDYDAIYTSDGSRLVSWAGSDYATLASFYAATGQEEHGVEGAPRLEDPASGDFRPQSGSPLIDAGELLPGINDDYVGDAPDIGAEEFIQYAAGIQRAGDQTVTSWQTVSGTVYQVQQSVGTGWMDQDAVFAATGAVVSIVETNDDASALFRLVMP